MKIINLLQDDVVLYHKPSGKPVFFPAEGPVQVRMKVEDVTKSGFIKRGHWTHTRDLPKPEPETLYIVSSLVAMFELYQNQRLDLLFPWGMVRNDEGTGRVVACRALCRPELPPTDQG